MAAFRLTTAAVGDLEDIWFYTRDRWSIEQADRYYSLIISEIDFIASNPLAGRSMEPIKTGYRSAKVKSHLIFYREDADGTVLIVRILHQSMDCRSRLGS